MAEGAVAMKRSDERGVFWVGRAKESSRARSRSGQRKAACSGVREPLKHVASPSSFQMRCSGRAGWGRRACWSCTRCCRR